MYRGLTEILRMECPVALGSTRVARKPEFETGALEGLLLTSARGQSAWTFSRPVVAGVDGSYLTTDRNCPWPRSAPTGCFLLGNNVVTGCAGVPHHCQVVVEASEDLLTKQQLDQPTRARNLSLHGCLLISFCGRQKLTAAAPPVLTNSLSHTGRIHINKCSKNKFDPHDECTNCVCD